MSLAYVMMNTVPDKLETVLEDIMELEGVEEVTCFMEFTILLQQLKLKILKS